MVGYLKTNSKSECYGCEACAQICNKSAITMIEDDEGFRYPLLDKEKCVECRACNNVCPCENIPKMHLNDKYVFGGYNIDAKVRIDSTSGGAFSAIVDVFCDKDYVIFGAESKGLIVFHNYIFEKNEITKFRKSKYSQSSMGSSYKHVKKFLQEGKKVLFSGTPCQIAGLKMFLGNTSQEKLLTVEVVCEGVPSPLYMRKYEKFIEKKYNKLIKSIDYRYTDSTICKKGKWDFEVMRTKLKDTEKELKIDRWFNPFWSIWLNHLMSRPSCYECPFASQARSADISLGDLWGVHLYCPELYGGNEGASLIVANTEKGKKVVIESEKYMYGHKLLFEEALKYQSPMRKHIDMNIQREEFMEDLKGDMSYQEINKKWAKKPTIKLLWQKYIWGNRQKVALWRLKQKLKDRS